MIGRTLTNLRLCRGFGMWKDVPTTPPDPILGLNEKFKESKDPRKVNLTVGAYRDENGKPWILPSVKLAMNKVHANMTEHEYLPIIGDKEFIELATKVGYGKGSKAVAEKRIGGAQTLSGCGAVFVGAQFLKKFYPVKDFTVYVTSPTWPIHNTLLDTYGIKNATLPYYDPKTKGLDFQGLCSTIEKAPERSVFMLHSCAHNPTGVDPTPEQWQHIADLIAKKHHFTFFDMAYQGFASGDLEKDNLSIQLWEKKGLNFCVAQSFAKSMGLYGQRVGTFSVICENSAEAAQVTSQLATIARNTWSSPPKYGAELAKTVLANPEMYNQWLADMKLMSGRIIAMRSGLTKRLKDLGNPHDWKHITNQIGMFAYTGLAKEQCQELMEKHFVFLTMNGRISVAGLNEKNLDYVANAFHDVTKDKKF